ncbi:MAG: DUF5131 family protein [Dehalococcoidales bacterium]|jgi:protein gp37|nr:DUF5131 family protein [Dehalococcoidales bacterium]
MQIPITKISLDKQAQPRTEINSEVVTEYAEAMKGGTQFPPVIVFGDNGRYWLADGWHRVMAAVRAGATDIAATVHNGGLRDAILYSTGANATNGLHRTNADKRRAVMALLTDNEWGRWSDREIARRAGVGHVMVNSLRRELSVQKEQIETARIVERNGTTYEMATERIGRHDEEPPIYAVNNGGNPTILLPHLTPPEPVQRESRPTFNRTNDNVDWAWWTWNPVTGCKHGCPYCYARDIARRFTGHFNPEFHPDRLSAPQNTNPITTDPAGDKVFVCSMADLFGAWVPQEWIDAVLEQVLAAPQWTFIFLSKNPERMATVDWPDNAWVGTTVDCQARVARATEAFKLITAPVRFLSVEPFREQLTFDDMSMFNWLLIGGQSATSGEPANQPKWWWVADLEAQAHRDGIQHVFQKPNLKRVEEYPL